MASREFDASRCPKEPGGTRNYFDFGSQMALEGKPVSLAFLTDHRNSVTPFEKMEFEDGYRVGTGKVLIGFGVKLPLIGVGEGSAQKPIEAALTHIFSEDAGIKGLNAGLAFQKPVVPSSRVRTLTNTASRHYEDGYRIGWTISSAKEYEKVPQAKAIPVTGGLFDIYAKVKKGDFSTIPAEDNIPEDLKPVILEGVSHWLGDKDIDSVKADVVVYLRPLVRIGFASVISGRKLPRDIVSHPDAVRGAGFARRLLEIRRNTRRNQEVMKGSV